MQKTSQSKKATVKPSSGAEDNTKNKDFTLGSLESLTGFAVRRVHQYLYAGLATVVEEAGMKPHQFTALSLIMDNPGISQIDLARVLQVKPSNMVPLLDELGSKGLVVRNANATTRRSYALEATDNGQALRNKALSLITEYEDGLLAKLSNSEKTFLRDLASKLCG